MEKEKESIRIRNHFTYVLEKACGLGAIAVFLILNTIVTALESILEESGTVSEFLLLAGKENGLLQAGCVLLVLFFIILWYIRRWYLTTLTIDEGNLVYERRTLFRYINTLSITNISNVNLEQNLWERLVKTYKVKIDTNSLSTANAVDLELILKKADALLVKRLILEKIKEQDNAKASGMAEQKQKEETDVLQTEYEITYSSSETIKSGLISVSLWQYIMVVLEAVSLFFVLGNGGEFGDMLSRLVTLFGAFLVIFAYMLKTIAADMNFQVKRQQNTIYVRCGLLTQKEYAVPIEKINAVSLEYTLLGRLCKRAYVKVVNVGGEGEEAAGVKIFLTDSYEELSRKMQFLLPEYALPETDRLKHSPVRTLVFNLVSVIFFSALGVFFGITVAGKYLSAEALRGIILPAVVFWSSLVVTCCIVIILSWQARGIYQGNTHLVLAKGIAGRSITNIAWHKIQYLRIKQGPIGKMFQFNSGMLSILAGAQKQFHVLGPFETEEFDRLEERFYQTYSRG